MNDTKNGEETASMKKKPKKMSEKDEGNTNRKSRRDKQTPRGTDDTRSQPSSPRHSPDTRQYDSAPEQRKDQSHKPAQNKNNMAARNKNSRSKDQDGDGEETEEPYSVRDHVRIFEMRKLMSRELQKTRRYQQQLGRAGAPVSGGRCAPVSGTTDRQLTRMIADDFNEKAHRGYKQLTWL